MMNLSGCGKKIAIWANESNDADSHRLLDRVYNATRDYNNEVDADKKEKLLWDASIYLDVLKSVYDRENSWLNVDETRFVALSLAKHKQEKEAEEQEKKEKIEAEIKQKQKKSCR